VWSNRRLDDEACWQDFLRIAEYFDRDIERLSDRVSRVHTGRELATALEQGKHAAILAVEDARLIAGDLTTLATFCSSWEPESFDLLVENYRRQIKGLINGGCDILVGETLLYQQEAEAILTAAELEGTGAVMYSFTMQADGSLFSGADACKVLQDLEQAGAAAVGFNCVAADMMTPYLVTKLRRYIKGPLICKPNAGIPVINNAGIAQYQQTPQEFAAIMAQCAQSGATLLGGCCGTDPGFISAIRNFS
jgi:5-methyltetrahydrofolate--homocysteine methyltransferase